ncbi:hypothetical protein A8H39_01670 [Paraburkholderia fungorum]|uniref:hypothetical protein n=1 Tax=Paraburkholderia fungorum TaxID=134537 RepID=UPI000481723A|nr:hypothetical protein [Paraburkholderia fungorum]MBB5546644.1 hypothetical protein [Paraburkholderia fungorum]PNE59880.1 hypothetical protein A8H39_01670 [Paraburkholderia fungorum]
MNAALTVALFALLSLLPQQIGSALMFVLSPVLLGAFAVLAQSADRARPAGRALLDARGGLLRILIFSTVTLAAITAVAGLAEIAAATFHVKANPMPQAQTLGSFAMGDDAAVTSAIWITLPSMWFAIPLFAISCPPVLIGTDLAFDAHDSNMFIWRLTLAFAVVSIVSTLALAGFSAVALYPIAGATMYVSFRDVFLGVPPVKSEEFVPSVAVSLPSFPHE